MATTDAGHINFVNFLQLGNVVEVGFVDHLNLSDLIETDEPLNNDIDHWGIGRLIRVNTSSRTLELEILFFNGEIVFDKNRFATLNLDTNDIDNIAPLGTYVPLTTELLNHIERISATEFPAQLMYNFDNDNAN